MLRRFAFYFGLVILLIVIPVSLVRPLRDKATHLVSPVTGYLIRQNVGIRTLVRNITDISQLRLERARLQAQAVDLQQHLIILDETQRENLALRKELGVTGITKNIPKAFGRVVTQGSDPFDRTFTLDVGKNEGVKEGQPVVFQGALVGRVITVRNTSCVVRSITSSQSRVQAWISDSREKGLLIGDGSTVYLSEINQGAVVPLASTIETSGLGGTLPQGILIGQTGASISKKSDQSQQFQLSINQDPSLLESAFVLLTDTP